MQSKDLTISHVTNIGLEEYVYNFLPWMIKKGYSIQPKPIHKNYGMCAEKVMEEYKYG